MVFPPLAVRKGDAVVDAGCGFALFADRRAKRDFEKVRPHRSALARVKVSAEHAVGFAHKLSLV
jgi:hypothetical protein